MVIGAQLYTLRDFCKTTDGLADTIRRVADIGYTAVQLSGICDYDAEWINELLKECDIVAPITHFSYDKIINQTDATIAFHKIFGAEYIGVGSIPQFKKDGCNLDIYEKFMSDIAPAVKKIKAAGLKFMYHNHNMEFMHLPNGKTLLDDIVSRYSADELGITLDCYWAQAGGADPAEWLKKLTGRVPCIHFKDMVYSPIDQTVRMAPVGSGNLNYPAIVEAALGAGVKYTFVEQDKCYEDDPFECMKRSYDYLVSLGLK